MSRTATIDRMPRKGTKLRTLAVAAGAASLVLGLVVHPPSPAQAAEPESLTWTTPGQYTWVVPEGVTEVHVDIASASGGNRPISDGPFQGGHFGGLGDRMQGTLEVTPGEQMVLDVAAQGTDGAAGGGGDSGGVGGRGWAHGGDGGSGSRGIGVPSYSQGGGGGGGSSYIGGPDYRLDIHLGGGGGAGGFAVCGGNPGGNTGDAGWKVSNNCASDGGDPGQAGVTDGFGANGSNANSSSGQGGGGGGGGGARGGGGADASTDGGGGGGGGISNYASARFTPETHTDAPRGNGFIKITPVWGTQTSLNHSAYTLIAGDELTLDGTVGYPGDGPGTAPEGTVRLESGSAGSWTTMATVPLSPDGEFRFVCDRQCVIDPQATQVRAVFLPPTTQHWTSSEAVSSLTVTQGATRTLLDVDPLTTVTGQQRELVTSVDVQSPASGTADGVVEFWTQPAAGGDAESLGTAELTASGQATLQATTPFPGAQQVWAVYAGSSWYDSSTSPRRSIMTEKAQTRISAVTAPQTTVYGQGYSVQVEVSAVAPGSGAPDGIVVIDGQEVALDGAGHAELVVDGSDAGTREFEVRYPGSDRYLASETTATHITERADTALAMTQDAASTSYGEAVQLVVEGDVVAPGAGEVDGEFEIWVDGSDTGVTGVFTDSRGEVELEGLEVGLQTIQARYQGSDNVNPAVSNEVVHEVIPTASAVEVSLDRDTLTVNSDALLQVQVTTDTGAVANGDVEVRLGSSDGEVLAEGTLDAGAAQLMYERPSIGDHELVAVYAGSENVTESVSGPVALEVVAAESITALTVPQDTVEDADIMLSARVDTAESELSMTNDLPDAEDSFRAALLPAGADAPGQWEQFVPTGEVQFLVDGAPVGAPVPLEVTKGVDGQGIAVAELSVTLPAGSHTVQARYTGEARVLGSETARQTVIVNEVPAAGSGGLAATGSDSFLGFATLGTLLLVIGAWATTRRRAH